MEMITQKLTTDHKSHYTCYLNLILLFDSTKAKKPKKDTLQLISSARAKSRYWLFDYSRGETGIRVLKGAWPNLPKAL